VPYFAAFLADACLTVGRAAEALDALAEALVFGHRSGTRFYEAELIRLKGIAVRSCTMYGWQEVEQSFSEAIQIARRQRAKSLELRIAMAMSRVYGERGRRAEGRALLAETYAWFTEGFETADLKEARALLEDLA
jgi:predicted ATPase